MTSMTTQKNYPEKARVVSPDVRVAFNIVYSFRANGVGVYPCHETKAAPYSITDFDVSVLFLFGSDSIGIGDITD